MVLQANFMALRDTKTLAYKTIDRDLGSGMDVRNVGSNLTQHHRLKTGFCIRLSLLQHERNLRIR